ncbi:acetyl-CoA carboxylase biotin carboxylase subunit [Helicovermis profundi]|uniref:Biotin carboxylase n=1 Tax=Helicovermis profundi TaxID=3065157 RepID=A0AAU9EP89_9FIRM|nr:acetyl-CoA carboxylase biotin carboxylase subunit [Clostridia bacterium S502]
MFKKILIANRGEIAVRIIRACREMGIVTVAVYSEIDKNALHTQLADESICIGSNKASDSYLNMKNILSATINSGADAIHPGFGFLSENPKFVRMCEECNIVFIGPSSDVIENMGDKSKAREMMINAGVPVVPGSDKILEDFEEVKKMADEIGFPVIIKASNGGGGKGMRIAYTSIELENAYNTARMEAKASFGDDLMYMEKYLVNPKHIEFQILADNFGNIVHLGERDCSMQRNNQKVMEEAPSSIIGQDLRELMGNTAVKGAKFVNYTSAGTMEFLLDNNNNYYFMEMNTRIQVEHPITELITGIDLIKEQIKIAANINLNYKQDNIKIHGHAIECRINAESPKKNFMPSPGEISYINLPGGYGVRNDISIYTGYKIPPNYDSMLGKIIVHANTRDEAINIMKRSLGEYIIKGVETNIDFQYDLISSNEYISGEFTTGYVSEFIKDYI